MHSSEIHAALTELSPKVRQGEASLRDQEKQVQALELNLVHGSEPGELASAKSHLESLRTSLKAIAADEHELVTAYEAAIIHEAQKALMESLDQISDDSGEAFAKYIQLRKNHGIFDGKTTDGMARDLLHRIKLNYLSGEAIDRFQKCYGTTIRS